MQSKLVTLASALLIITSGAASAKNLLWKPGWDIFDQPLNYTSSNLKYSVNNARRELTLTATLVGAVPSKLHQISAHIFNVCPNPPQFFGNFPVPAAGGCQVLEREGRTATIIAVELGVVLTDANGNGTAVITVGPIESGTYQIEIIARDGAGCNVVGGSGGSLCAADYQSPGPFPTTFAVVVP